MDNRSARRDTRYQLRRATAVVRSTRADGTSWLLLGSLVAGFSAYGFQFVGGRGLGAEAFGPIATLWTVQYIVTAIILLALEQFEVRAVAAAGGDATVLRRVWPTLWAIVIGVSVAVGATLLALADRALLGLGDLALAGGAWVITTAALAMVRGIYGGRAEYRVAGIATGSDGLVRFLIALPVLLVLGTTGSLAWILPLGPIPFLVWWWLRGAGGHRAGGTASGGRAVPRVGRFLAGTAFANGTLHLLLGAGPLVVALLGGSASEVSAFFITTSLARAPLLLGIGLVPRLLTPLTRWAEAGDYAHVRGAAWAVVAMDVTLAVGAGALAYLLGPTIIGWLYGGEFAVSALATAAAVAAVVVALGALALNQVLAAENRPHRLVPAWIAGLGVAIVAVILLPVEPLARVACAVLAGQLAAICALALAIVTVDGQTGAVAD